MLAQSVSFLIIIRVKFFFVPPLQPFSPSLHFFSNLPPQPQFRVSFQALMLSCLLYHSNPWYDVCHNFHMHLILFIHILRHQCRSHEPIQNRLVTQIDFSLAYHYDNDVFLPYVSIERNLLGLSLLEDHQYHFRGPS